MSEKPSAISRDWQMHWPLVLATTAGFTLHAMATYATGLFIQPLADEFGWSRAVISVGLTITAVATAIFSPFLGVMIDRWGSRRLGIFGTVVTGYSFASFGLANGSSSQWILLWASFAFVSLAANPMVWTTAVSGVFSAARGIALGVTVSGVAIAQIVVPPLSYWLIETYGWRAAFHILGLGWGVVALVPVALFMFDARDRERAQILAGAAKAGRTAQLGGLSIREAMRSLILWRIGCASFLTMFFGLALVVHQVPVLTEAGVSRAMASLLASAAGVAAILGKLMTGWLMDRRDAGSVGSITLTVASLGFLLLLGAFRTPGLIIVGMLIIGYSTGAKFQISAYLTGRYGGISNFGKIFGAISSLVCLGAGLGPFVAGAIRDTYGTYTPLLVAGIIGSILSGLLILHLGPYPQWPDASTASDGTQRDDKPAVLSS